ncbi:MAG: flagellar hook-associated protein FlgK [Planctomycetota bacterium]
MSLTSTMQIGRSALTASQIGLQITGNNLANAATPGYSRQLVSLSPARGQDFGQFVLGKGVDFAGVRRQVDEALQERLRASISDQSAAETQFSVLTQLETVIGELTTSALSDELISFFNTWSDATSLLQSEGVIVEQGAAIAEFITSLREELERMRNQVEQQIDDRVRDANTKLDEVAILNKEIAATELSGGGANDLRDRRDQLLEELSGFMDVTLVESGTVADVLVGSIPVVLGGENRGLSVERVAEGDKLTAQVRVDDDGSVLNIQGGEIGGLLASRDGSIDDTIERLDDLAVELIFEINKIHTTGTNAGGKTLESSTLPIPIDDRALSLNDPLNPTFASLPFQAVNGGFLVNVENQTTGATNQVRIDVDLDGLTDAGVAGFADDTSAADIVAALDAIPGINAGFDTEGRLEVTAEPGFGFNFEDDSSGVLAVMGLGAFFTGTGSSDIAVREDLVDNPTRLSVGRMENGSFIENGTALAIVELQDTPLSALDNRTFLESWSDASYAVGVAANSAETQAAGDALVRENLIAQRAGVSGVSTDEESINLITFQRQYEAAARLISVADEMLQTLLSVV